MSKQRDKLREKIANLNIYMPKGEMKRFIGTDLSDQIISLFPDTEELKKQINIRRDNAFNESLFGSLEHQVGMQSKVRAYDEVLNIIKEME